MRPIRTPCDFERTVRKMILVIRIEKRRQELTSMATDRTISLALNETSGAYLTRPCSLIKRFFTVERKYQLRPASTRSIKTLDVRSQYLLTKINLNTEVRRRALTLY